MQDVIEGLKIGKRGPKATGLPREAKFQNPHNKLQKWSGIGRKPQWYLDLIEGGMSPKDLEIH